tara:strand:+ start:1462 stop:2241 length:780 start_codon:yes stop_codon:yes gene_type:complete
MPIAPVNGIEIEYQEFGPFTDGSEAVIFLHGAGGNLLSWFQQIPYFSRKFRCVTFSHRGFGHSADTNSLGVDSFVEDLEELLGFLKIEKVHLISQSMGGRTALGFAVKYPDRVLSLTLADTTGAIGEPDVEEALIRWRESHKDDRGIGVRALSEAFRCSNHNMSNLYLQIQKTNPIRDTSQTMLLGGTTSEELNKLTMPVMFLVGEDDLLTPPHVIDIAAGYIKGCKVTVVPDCGHSVYFEKPDVFNFEVGRFISDSSD